MSEADIVVRLQEIFDSVFVQPVKVTDSVTREDVAEWDSLNHVQLIMVTENAFNIRFSAGEVGDLLGVAELKARIAAHLAKRDANAVR
jgi:acyl carrier protein